MTVYSQSSTCLCVLSVEIKDVCHHTWQNQDFLRDKAGHPPNSQHCQPPPLHPPPWPLTLCQGHQGKACAVGGPCSAGGHEVDMIQTGRLQVVQDKAMEGDVQGDGCGWSVWSVWGANTPLCMC